MKRAARILIAALVCALFFAAAATASPPTVYLVNHSTVVSDTELANWLPALQEQVSGEFSDVWNLDARLVATTKAPAGAWQIEITDEATVNGALGYHDVCNTDGHGSPCGYVFAGTTEDAGGVVSSVLDHELLELLADPYITTFEKVRKRMYLREVCDPIESDAYAYTRQGADGSDVLLSDFVTPFYYRPGHLAPYDFTAAIAKPLQVLPGGYISWWQSDGWHQKFARGLRGVS